MSRSKPRRLHYLSLRLSRQERAEYGLAAARNELSLSDWARTALSERAREDLSEPREPGRTVSRGDAFPGEHTGNSRG